MTRILFLTVLTLSLSSCNILFERTPADWDWTFKPHPLAGTRNFPSVKTPYGQGFKDGCESGLDIISKGLVADKMSTTYNYKLMQKTPDYDTGWWDGFEHCTYMVDNDTL